MPEPSSAAMNVAVVGSDTIEMRLAPESRALATISVRIVSSSAPG